MSRPRPRREGCLPRRCLGPGQRDVSRPRPRGFLPRGCLGPHPGGSRSTPRGCPDPHPEGCSGPGLGRGLGVFQHALRQTPPRDTATAAGGIHPTGMHSCSLGF